MIDENCIVLASLVHYVYQRFYVKLENVRKKEIGDKYDFFC